MQLKSQSNALQQQDKMSEKNKEYFEKQIKGFLMIMEDAPKNDVMVARSYVKEKLNMILKEGINFHPLIKEKLNTGGKTDG